MCYWLILKIVNLKCCIAFVARGMEWTFKERTINVISLLIYIGDKITELKELSWVIRRVVPCNSVVKDEKDLQMFSLFHSFHLKWKSITSSTWCFMLCPSICCGKEVGWRFTLYILNWSHAMKKLCLMVTTGFTHSFLPVFSILLLNIFWCYVGGVTWITKTCQALKWEWKKQSFAQRDIKNIGIMCTVFLSSISASLQHSKLLVGCVFKTSWMSLGKYCNLKWAEQKLLLYPHVNISQLVR